MKSLIGLPKIYTEQVTALWQDQGCCKASVFRLSCGSVLLVMSRLTVWKPIPNFLGGWHFIKPLPTANGLGSTMSGGNLVISQHQLQVCSKTKYSCHFMLLSETGMNYGSTVQCMAQDKFHPSSRQCIHQKVLYPPVFVPAHFQIV